MSTASGNKEDVEAMRIDYKVGIIDPDNLPSKDPFEWFNIWFQEAVQEPCIAEANVMNLATATNNGRVSARMVLLKGHTEKGFRFFTNYGSEKGKQLLENPYAALTFYWEAIQKQVRISGHIEKVSEEESIQYFHRRPYASQIGAAVSEQSTVIPDNRYLEARRKELVEKFEGKVIPKPDCWGGYLVIPERFEFWCGGGGRLHDRVAFRYPNVEESIDSALTKQGDNGWLYEWLAP